MNPTDLPDLPPAKRIEVHLQKANFFRVVHVDGVWCSVNINKDIHMSLYSERYPLPKRIFFPTEGGTGEIAEERDTKRDWVREIEVDAVMSLNVARQVHDHLGRFIKFVEEMK
jgi:hypothetical protein